MKQVYVKDLAGHAGERVRLCGWAYNRRSKGRINFLLVRDGTGIVQCVAGAAKVSPETFALTGSVPQESSVVVEGVVHADDRAPGGHELALEDLRVVQEAHEYPIALQSHGPDFLLSHRHLWLRSRKQAAVMRVRSRVVKAIRDFLDGEGFVLLDAPVFTPSACEGTTTLFEVPYFDLGTAYLTQSGQLYMEAGAMALGRVYCFGPVFRAEKSKTRRHLTEFWMVEPEIAWAGLDDVMGLSERFLLHIIGAVLEHNRDDLEVLERNPAPLEALAAPFPRITYDAAVDLLRSKGLEMEHGDDLGSPQETALGEHFGSPVMVHRWPAATKAFYMKRDPGDPGKVLGVDVIGPEGAGELIGGGQREDDLETLEGAIREHGLPEEAFSWYTDLRRYGSVPHAGFGLGLERTVAWICGREHIRECIPFPRMLYRIHP